MANNGIASIDSIQTNNIQTTPSYTSQTGTGAAFLQSMAGLFNVSAVVAPPKVNPITPTNPFKGKTFDQIRAALTALVKGGQQQTAALQFTQLMDADINTAMQTFQYYTSHIDKGTAEAIFSVMAQNNMPDKIDSFVKKLGTLLPDNQQVCANIFGKYANVRSYKNIALNAIYAQPTSICIASDSLKDDKDVVLAAVKNCFYAFQYASNRLKDDKNIVLTVVKQYGGNLKDVSTRLKNDKEVVGAAVQQNGQALQFASTILKNDKYIVSDAVKQDGLALQFASSTLKNDKDVVSAAVKQNGFAIEYASDTLKNDKDIIAAASIKIRASLTDLVKNGQQQSAADQFVTLMNSAFQAAVNTVQNNTSHMDRGTAKAIFSVMAQNNMPDKIDSIFKQLGPSNVNTDLQNVCSDLIETYANVRSYKYIVWSAILTNGNNIIDLMLASSALQDDKEVVLAAVKKCGNALEYASATLRNDKDVVLAAVKKNGYVFQYASATLRNDKDVALIAVSDNIYAFPYASTKLKDDKDVVLAALTTGSTGMQKDQNLLQYASARVKNDATFQMDLVSEDINLYEYFINNPASSTVKAFYNNTKAALNSLGITLYSRFSDTKEIIRNRYSVSTQAEKNKLISLLGADYFKGVSTDTRPVAVITTPTYDWNGVMSELSGKTSPLTKGYKLIYYEVSTDTQFINSVKEATIDSHQQAQMLIICGHGSPTCIEFGDPGTNQDFLDMGDTTIMNQLKGAVADFGQVIESSCDNGYYQNGNTPGIDNIAEYIHSYWPNTFVHAAKSDLGTMIINLDKNNLFSSVSFDGTNGLTLPPVLFADIRKAIHVSPV
jgi:hypothetical protein